MIVRLYRELNPIKNGWSSRCVPLGLAAHGRSPEIADKNLERGVRLFLMPFQREGTLMREAEAMGLGAIASLDDVQFAIEQYHVEGMSGDDEGEASRSSEA